MKRYSIVVTTLLAMSVAFLLASACTRQERAIVRSVVDFVDDTCAEHDSLDDCLGKMQAKRDVQLGRKPAAADAGAD